MPFIFVSGTIGEDAAVEAMRSGASDYLGTGDGRILLSKDGGNLFEPTAVQATGPVERLWADPTRPVEKGPAGK